MEMRRRRASGQMQMAKLDLIITEYAFVHLGLPGIHCTALYSPREKIDKAGYTRLEEPDPNSAPHSLNAGH